MEKVIEFSCRCEIFFIEEEFKKTISSSCGINYKNLHYKILRKSIDARKRPIFKLKLLVSDSPIKQNPIFRNYQDVTNGQRVIVVGAHLLAHLRHISLLGKQVLSIDDDTSTRRTFQQIKTPQESTLSRS